MKLDRVAAMLFLVACGGDSTKAPATPIVVADPAPAASASGSAEGQAAEASEDGLAEDTMTTPPSSNARAASVSLRQGASAVNGKLPPEVVQRVVRRSFGKFRTCYEDKIRPNKDLGGRVTVKFVIAQTGDVSQASDGGSDLPDSKVVACVVKEFGALKFPKPDSGIVTVVYPVIFTPEK